MESFRFLFATSFYPPYHLGGDAVHVQYLARALAARGHEVHVEFSPAAYRLKRKEEPRPARDEEGIQVHAIPSRFGRAQPIAAYLLGRSRGVARFHDRLLRETRPDVVHLHNISLLGSGVLNRPRDGVMAYTAHDYWARCPRSDLLKYGTRMCQTPSCVSCCLASRRPPQLWRYGKRWRGLPGLDFAIAPSRFMARAIASSLRCPVVHIPNFAPDPNPGGVLWEPEDYYLYVGVLEPHKGLLELAAAATLPGGPRVKVVGRGSLEGRLRSLQRRGLARIEVEGWVSSERLSHLYRHARALVIPSTWAENAPLVALEALAWGTPLLASPRGGLSELLHEGTAGRSFEPTPEALVSAVEGFEAGDLARALRPGSRAAYAANHRPQGYVNLYIDLIQGRRGAAPAAHAAKKTASGNRASVAALTSTAGLFP